VINLPSIEFTLAPGASADQYELHKYNSSALSGDPIQKLVYTANPLDVPKDLPSAASLFLFSSSDSLPVGWNVDVWTVTTDYWGRSTLGLKNYMSHDISVIGLENKWFFTGQAWNNYTTSQSSDPNACLGGICSAGVADGECFGICRDCYTKEHCQHLDCYGIPVEIEVVKVVDEA